MRMTLNQKKSVLWGLLSDFRKAYPAVQGVVQGNGTPGPTTNMVDGFGVVDSDLDELIKQACTALDNADIVAGNRAMVLKGFRDVLDGLCRDHKICERTDPPMVRHEHRLCVATLVLQAADMVESPGAPGPEQMALERLGQLILEQLIDGHGLGLTEQRVDFLRTMAIAAGIEGLLRP